MNFLRKILLGFSWGSLGFLISSCATHRAAYESDLTTLIVQEVREETVVKVQEKEPLVASDVMEMIQKQVETDVIARVLQSRGGRYVWSEEELKQFRAAGADESLLAVLASIPRTAEKPNAEAFDKTGYKSFNTPPVGAIGPTTRR